MKAGDIDALMKPENILAVNKHSFDELALNIFQYQYQNNNIYRQYCDAIHTRPNAITTPVQIPFLPIAFFKSHIVKSGDWQDTQLVFESSGTSGTTNSRHYIKDADLYRKNLLAGFRQFYGYPGDYTILALLPSYLERPNSSLVFMAAELMKESAMPGNHFYINELDELAAKLQEQERAGQQTLLLGVTFALVDFARSHPAKLQHTTVMETGGMKGKREEWTRAQLHILFEDKWQLKTVHSEYGMTELLSQAYSSGNGIYKCTNTMRVFSREINDPLSTSESGQGCINVIDLANVHSCAFIATEDTGTVHVNGDFEISGRLDHSALRGCSLMVL